ncbi:hypothetical protein B566_EDAN005511 [Ephemera danica]|nr:hypothetical protein B566_EDAN005511 [Ephemera danica]
MESKPINCIGKRTRSTTKHRVLSTHRQTSELHRAISLRDKNRVKRLIKNGQKLCNGVGINCFILAQSVCNWDFLQYLLSVDPYAGVRAKNYQGQTLLMLYSKSHKLKETQLMMELGADANDCSNDGETALMLAVEKWYIEASNRGRGYHIFGKSNYSFYKSHRKDYQDIVNLLLQRGADVNFCRTSGENVLHIAVRNYFTFNLEMFRTLIEAGVDPTTENREHCTVLSCAMEVFTGICLQFDMDAVRNEVYPAFRYLLDLAPFQRDTFQLHCPGAKHPQTILLKRLSVCQMLTQNIEIFTDLIGNNKNLIDAELVFLHCFQYLNNNTSLDVSRIERTELPFGPIAHYLNYEHSDVTNHCTSYRYNPIENLQLLLSVGLTVNTKSYETLSPLTVGLLNCSLFYIRDEYETFARYLVTNGAHVEQRLLIFVVEDEELDQLSAALCLPDVLRVSLSQKCFPTPVMPESISSLFPFLSSYGSLQHSPLYKTVKDRILNTHCLSDEELHAFNSMNNSIPLLQELCRTAVRVHLAPRASQLGNSLPGLIREIQPLAPGLRNLLLNVTPNLP